jgi:hypothetical protein
MSGRARAMSAPTKGSWEAQHGAARRAIDRALLEEAERQISSQPSIEDEIRETIAREFGSPAHAAAVPVSPA